jgi:hypothetical protein
MRFERYLTAEDHSNLASYDFKCKEVKAYSLACLKGAQTGLLLFGAGGNGKSYSVRETLQERAIKEVQPEDTMEREPEDPDEDGETPKPKEFGYDSWVNHQGRITPKGLVKEMARFPQSLHLVEDAETMFDDKNCWGVLRMALHSQDHSIHSQRRITWKISTKDFYDFFFSGSLVIVGNRLLSENMEEIEAVKTRCPCVNFAITNGEMSAKMKSLCEKGYKMPLPPSSGGGGLVLTREDCYDVCEYLLTSIESDPELKRDSRGKEKKLNFRILISGFRFMALSRIEPTINWKSMLLSQLKQLIGASQPISRDYRTYDHTQIAHELAGRKFPTQHDKLVEWCRRTERDLAWSVAPEGSADYTAGFNTAKSSFARMNKRK